MIAIGLSHYVKKTNILAQSQLRGRRTLLCPFTQTLNGHCHCLSLPRTKFCIEYDNDRTTYAMSAVACVIPRSCTYMDF